MPITPLSASLPMIASLFDSAAAPDVEDIELSRLPWDQTQTVFAGGVLRNSRAVATAGWHGNYLDAEQGAVAIVRSDGPLAAMVGERIKVSRDDRVVYVYVHDEQAFPDELAGEDLSLSRRAFLGLAPWSVEALEVIVEIVS